MSQEEFISSTLSISIPEFSEKYIDSKTVTFYIVEVKNNASKLNWSLEKRYSEFENLHKHIFKMFPNIPEIPGKSLFKIKAYEALTKRRLQLEAFLRECARRKDIVSYEMFKTFLEIEKHSPELKYNEPTKLNVYLELPLGARDFYYYSRENILYVAACDMNISSRVDAYITNVNLPWEKKTNSHISVGASFAFRLNANSTQGYIYEKLWAKSFREQTGVIAFDEESLMVQVGLDTGRIALFQTSQESQFIQYNEKFEAKPHKNRIMGLGYDSEKGIVYSCASDKKFMYTHLHNSISNTIAESEFGFTAMIFDKTNKRIFLTNEGGVCFVYLFRNDPIELVNIIQTHTENVIRGVFIDYRRSYLFTATSKGDISLMELGPPGKEKFIKEITYFGGNVEIRVMQYNSENNELFTGDQNGKITVWSLKTGESIYAWKAHTGAITQMLYDESKRILLTGSKDKQLIHWVIPSKWVNDEIAEFEKNEMKNINNTLATLRIQKALAKLNDDDNDSDDDSLNGWDLRP